MKRIFRKFVKAEGLSFDGQPSNTGLRELSINFNLWLKSLMPYYPLRKYWQGTKKHVIKIWVSQIIEERAKFAAVESK